MMWVVWLLRAGWAAAILPQVIAIIPWQKLNAFRRLIVGFANRGKVPPSSSRKFSVPQKLFTHFYIVGFFWTTFLLAATWHYAYKTSSLVLDPSSVASHITGGSNGLPLHQSRSSSSEHRYSIWKSVFLLFLMETHVLRRLLESIYVFKYSPSARMHVAGYFVGISFYIAAPLSLLSMHALEVLNYVANLFSEFVGKGKDTIQETEVDVVGLVNPLSQFEWYVWIGTAIFFWGWIHQRRCHAILGSLRKKGVKPDAYVIPLGDWFEYVSSPHYFAEIVLYAGLVVASGFTDITIWLLFLFVVCNLSFAAVETHKWYIQKFEDYPTKRRAIIPFIL
ncbi:polyprenol reductase 2-like [Andrographis paniculata]|uniref:polyprenol reductase 2-like n=1 Tax=Andrographis paniculata TaxID=175694 RepID=UPI0021E7E45F|nr:polyprenol reductase 2-like [Andrographis paniculata]